MGDLKWEEPPPVATGGKAGKGKWFTLYNQLRERPGQWALVAENIAAGTKTYLKEKFPDMEVVCRGVQKGRAEKMYARYVGEESK